MWTVCHTATNLHNTITITLFSSFIFPFLSLEFHPTSNLQRLGLTAPDKQHEKLWIESIYKNPFRLSLRINLYIFIYTHWFASVSSLIAGQIIIMRNSIGDDDSFDCRVLKKTARLPLPGQYLYQLIVLCRCGLIMSLSFLRCFSVICDRLVDSYIDLEDSEEEEEESDLEIGCPYCSEGFDALGLCVHLEDQHPIEIKSGVNDSTILLFHNIHLNFIIPASSLTFDLDTYRLPCLDD